jgi:hypothetical protein
MTGVAAGSIAGPDGRISGEGGAREGVIRGSSKFERSGDPWPKSSTRGAAGRFGASGYPSAAIGSTTSSSGSSLVGTSGSLPTELRREGVRKVPPNGSSSTAKGSDAADGRLIGVAATGGGRATLWVSGASGEGADAFGEVDSITETWISNGSISSRSPVLSGYRRPFSRRKVGEFRNTPFELFVSMT